MSDVIVQVRLLLELGDLLLNLGRICLQDVFLIIYWLLVDDKKLIVFQLDIRLVG